MTISTFALFIALVAPYCSVEPKDTGDTGQPGDTGDSQLEETGDSTAVGETGDTRPANQSPVAEFTRPNSDDVVTNTGYVRVRLELSDDRDAPGDLELAWNAAALGAKPPASAGGGGVAEFYLVAPIAGPWLLECTVTDLDGASTTASVEFTVWSDDDADGYISDAEGGDDCDDDDFDVNPGAEEICGDGIDNDCSDGDEVCP